MKNQTDSLYRFTFILSLLATVALLFNMITIPLFDQQILVERDTISTIEIFILIGFAFFFLFNIESIIWMILKMRKTQSADNENKVVLALGVFCLLLFFPEKIIIDEISREYILGWETLGEWLILYAFLITQMIYSVIILWQSFSIFRISPKYRNGKSNI